MNRKLAASKITGNNTSQVFLLAISACVGIVLSLLVWTLLAHFASSFAGFILLIMPAIVYPLVIVVLEALLLLGGFISLLDAFSSKNSKKYILCSLGAALLVIGVRFSLIVILVFTKVF